MGDCGQYKANVSVAFKVRKKEKNTEEESLEFLKERKLIIRTPSEANEENIKNAYKEGKRIILDYRDWESWDSDYYIEEDILNGFEEYYEKHFYDLSELKEAKLLDIEYLDLDLVKEFDIKEIANDFSHSVNILDIYASIYCENDNTSQDSVEVNSIELKRLLELPEAEIILLGDGNGNC